MRRWGRPLRGAEIFLCAVELLMVPGSVAAGCRGGGGRRPFYLKCAVAFRAFGAGTSMCLQGLLGGKWVSALEAEANQPLVVLLKEHLCFLCLS